MKKFVLLAALLGVLAVIAACAPAPAPTAAPAPTTAPAPAATAVPAAKPTEAPKPAGTISGTLTLWHAYHTGGSEEKALNQLLDQIKKDNPNLKLTVLAVPFDQLFNKYETEAAAGGGPDLWTAPNDNLGNEVRANLLKPIDDQLKGKLDKYSKLSIDGVTVGGKMYAVPMIVKAVALYYNKDKVKSPPKTTDELMALVKGGNSIVLNQNNYHNFGFFPAFGGTLMDAKGACTADQGGFADAMQYLVDLKKAGAKFETDGGKADTMFRQKQVDMIINGPWVLGDYAKDLGASLGVVPMPAGPKGPAKPLSGIDGWYVNVNTKNVDAAVALGLALTTAEAQKVYADVAGDPPVRTDVSVADPLVKAFADAGAAGFPRPQSAEFGNWWGPFGDMVTKVMEGKATPKDGVAQACADMNKANKIAVAPPPVTAPKACEKMSNALAPKAGELGAADKPVVITFVPSVDVGLITKGGTAMAECLSKMTGLTYKIEVGTSETASVEAMGGNKAQMGFLNTFAVLLAKEKYDIDVALVAQRTYGVLKADKTYTAFDFDPDKALAGKLTSFYKPEYYTKAGSGIKTLADVKGKSFCFTSASSTSGGIIPRAVFKAMGIDPDKDMKSSYAGGHDKAAISVYDGTCDAGVAFMDILTDSATNLVGKFPDIQQKVQVFAVGDRIPNDGLQFVKGLDPKIRDITVEALLAMMADPVQNAVVKGIYNYDAFEKADYAKYYGPFNDTLKKAGIDVSSLVRK